MSWSPTKSTSGASFTIAPAIWHERAQALPREPPSKRRHVVVDVRLAPDLAYRVVEHLFDSLGRVHPDELPVERLEHLGDVELRRGIKSGPHAFTPIIEPHREQEGTQPVNQW